MSCISTNGRPLVVDGTVLEDAAALVGGDRQVAYGHPSDHLADVAEVWGVILGVRVEPRQVALCMVGLKLAREAHATKRDNLVDAAGYLRLAEMVS